MCKMAKMKQTEILYDIFPNAFEIGMNQNFPAPCSIYFNHVFLFTGGVCRQVRNTSY